MSQEATPAPSAPLWARIPAQRTRLIRLTLPGEDGMDLLAQTVEGTESVNGPFHYEVDAQGPLRPRSLKSFLGHPAGFWILLPDGSLRYRCGLITRAERLGAEGGIARYRFALESALAVLDRTQGSRLWQDVSIPTLVTGLLEEFRQRLPTLGAAFAVEAPLRRTYPSVDLKVMHRESHRAFLERTLAQAGIGWTWRFQEDDCPRHTLVLFDDPEDLPAGGTYRFHRNAGVESQDAIHRFHGHRTLQAGRVSLASWNEIWAGLDLAGDGTAPEGAESQPPFLDLEWYDGGGLRRAGTAEGLDEAARLHQAWENAAALGFRGEGNVRALGAGQWFQLDDHPGLEGRPPEARRFTLTTLAFSARNNLPGLPACDLPPFQMRFEARPRSCPLPPDPRPAPRAWGPQLATVAGPRTETVHVDPMGRILVHFPWMRALEHPQGGPAGPTSCWIRIAWPCAGSAIGFQALPRVGDEVLVEFVEGDLDRPVVVGSLHHVRHVPPRLGGQGALPANRALSGLRTQEHGGTLASELTFDDTPGQVQTRLGTEAHHSALSLGQLTSPRIQGCANPRGSGAELRTDGTLALRAAQGLLLTAEPQPQGQGPQMARRELLEGLQAGRELTESLGSQSEGLHGPPAHHEGLTSLHQRLQDWETGPAPHRLLALSAPDGLALTSHRSTALHTADQLHLSAGSHATFATGGQLALHGAQGLGVCAHQGGLQVLAHRDTLDLEAQQGEVNLQARKQVRLTSTESDLLLVAHRTITLVADGAYLKLGGGQIEIGCTGTLTGKASRHDWQGPASLDVDLAKLPTGKTRRAFRHVVEGTDQPIANARYRITLPDGRKVEGRTDTEGLTQEVVLDTLATLEAHFPEAQP